MENNIDELDLFAELQDKGVEINKIMRIIINKRHPERKLRGETWVKKVQLSLTQGTLKLK